MNEGELRLESRRDLFVQSQFNSKAGIQRIVISWKHKRRPSYPSNQEVQGSHIHRHLRREITKLYRPQQLRLLQSWLVSLFNEKICRWKQRKRHFSHNLTARTASDQLWKSTYRLWFLLEKYDIHLLSGSVKPRQFETHS